MKALSMSFLKEAKAAINNPVSSMQKLCGGIGDKPLTYHQITNIIRKQREEKKKRKEKEEWEKFLFSRPKAKK